MEKPEIEPPMTEAPTELLVRDITVGTGSEATAGAVVDVHYVGVDFESGEEFDSSWNRGQSISFPLNGLVRGWQEGIPGMAAGASSCVHQCGRTDPPVAGINCRARL